MLVCGVLYVYKIKMQYVFWPTRQPYILYVYKIKMLYVYKIKMRTW